MWAAVPATPDVVTLPVTAWQLREVAEEAHLDGAIKMSALPDALVVTGGTSWLPLS